MSLYKDPQGGENWYCYFKLNGRKVRRSTGTQDEAAALLFEANLRVALSAEPVPISGVTWLDACADWLNATSRYGKPRSESDKYSLNEINFSYANRRIEEVTAASFKPLLVNKSLATQNRVATILNSIMKRAGLNHKIVKHPTPKASFLWLTSEQWEALRKALPEHLVAPATFSLYTGLRQANTLSLTWTKVDLKRKLVWVLPEEAKGNEYISIPLSPEALIVLREQQGKHVEWVFPFEGRGRAAGAPVANVKNAFQNACHRAGIGKVVIKDGRRKYTGFSWHDFRHTFASWHVMNGTPLEVLQKLGGWADVRMVQRYAHLDPGHVAQYASNIKPYSRAEALETA